MSNKKERKYVYKTTLKKVYGLTDKMIQELGEPDKKVTNPHYASGPKSSLYLIDRVEYWIEENKDWVERAHAQRAERCKASKKALEKKFTKTIEWAETVDVEIIQSLPSQSDLYELAKWQFENYWHLDREQYHLSFRGQPKDILNFVRHNLTNYETLLNELSGKFGAQMAYFTIRDRVDEAAMSELRKIGFSLTGNDNP